MVFRGEEGIDCERFIMAVKKEAFSQGKLRDDDWIAGLVETHLEGPALLWFETLDDDTQRSWKLLKRALLAHYPPGSSNLYGRRPRYSVSYFLLSWPVSACLWLSDL